ncbi:four helix bundle protein [Niabella ginsengisoli]|uniref:Four helix bundle protein n=1 Tax=Niabella ginsengisoli TaxID=522298 RepID=A0ABS9SEZ4_9BACT|nr:four helix bundle protein [Niabella ginsengisoli]MCH5596928.1 four helix bundle protein [Niabella ginsengisoli]
MTNYKNLEAWKKSMELVKAVYFLTKQFPKEELYALTSQTNRAVVSIPCNIAEGIVRNYKKDTIQFLHVSRGSIYELETLLNIAVMVEIITESDFEPLAMMIDECIKILNGLIKYFETSALK